MAEPTVTQVLKGLRQLRSGPLYRAGRERLWLAPGHAERVRLERTNLPASHFDNVLLGSDPVSDQYLDPFTPLSVLANRRGSGTVNVKRVWGQVNTQLGEFMFGRIRYNWGLGILHNDGNCLDCDYGDTYDRVVFPLREFKGHHFTVMFDLLDKGQGTTGDRGKSVAPWTSTPSTTAIAWRWK